jgi:tetratricopeptide (TPR) repeat protein
MIEDGIRAIKETGEDSDLLGRYHFYAGQSYKDMKTMNPSFPADQAISHYLQAIQVNNWNQERFVACVELGKLYEKEQNETLAILHYFNSIKHDPQRIEGLVLGCKLLAKQGNHVLVNAMYHKFKDYKMP